MQKYDGILIDAGTGNLHSVYNALRQLGFTIKLTSDPADLKSGGPTVLPGVGAFGSFMKGLREKGLYEAVLDTISNGTPLLGICVGMQALFDVGEEMGTHQGLGALQGKVVRFPEFADLKVPHTGWNQLSFSADIPLFKDLPQGSYAYFNHAYYCAPQDPACSIATTDYGFEYTSAVRKDNVYGVQFHPEKSQKVGLKILENFIRNR
jgi:glutamine amidotransferase